MATLSYGRYAEREADDLAQQILKDANISTAGLVSFFERLSKLSGTAELLSFLSTHPASGERAASIKQNSDTGGAAVSQADWQALNGICSKLDR